MDANEQMFMHDVLICLNRLVAEQQKTNELLAKLLVNMPIIQPQEWKSELPPQLLKDSVTCQLDNLTTGTSTSVQGTSQSVVQKIASNAGLSEPAWKRDVLKAVQETAQRLDRMQEAPDAETAMETWLKIGIEEAKENADMLRRALEERSAVEDNAVAMDRE